MDEAVIVEVLKRLEEYFKIMNFSGIDIQKTIDGYREHFSRFLHS
jgi:hypothetical protein